MKKEPEKLTHDIIYKVCRQSGICTTSQADSIASALVNIQKGRCTVEEAINKIWDDNKD